MKYKVCILAAGVGSRVGDFSDYINKAILPVNSKAAISYIIEKFPEDIEIVIAVGHKKETVINYLSLAYPERKFTYVEIDKYIGPGAGPGYSLLQCREYLQSPFVFFAADTIVIEDIPVPDHNWFGIAPVKDTENYCTVKIKNNLVYRLDDKIKTSNRFAFIGLAGICDYNDFFSSLEKNKEIIGGEIQVSNGFKKLIEKKLVPTGFTWFDTGTLKNYIETDKNFSGGEKKFDFGKSNEFLYFVNDRVIKFFANEKIAEGRFKRASTVLKGLCPDIEGMKGNFYSYKKVDGQTLYSVLDNKTLCVFLQWAKLNLWKDAKISDEEKRDFYDKCHKFYHEKTKKRLNMFYEKKGTENECENINGVSVPPLKKLLSSVDWSYVSKGTPSNFHGDLQFDNVLVAKDFATSKPKFVLLDWRQDFAGLTRVGDLYYDLAKLYGGMTMSYPLIKEGMFSFESNELDAHYNFFVKNNLVQAKDEYELFLKENGFDIRKVKIITALIFLNMSPLHHEPFDSLLYYLGRDMLYKSLNILD